MSDHTADLLSYCQSHRIELDVLADDRALFLLGLIGQFGIVSADELADHSGWPAEDVASLRSKLVNARFVSRPFRDERFGLSQSGRDLLAQIGLLSRAGSPIRVMIADDHYLIKEALKSLLEPEFEVIGVVSDGLSLVQDAFELKPDLILLDVTLPLLSGLDAGERIRQTLPSVKLIFLTMYAHADTAAEALRRGARGFVLKGSAARELRGAIRKVVDGGLYISPEVADFLDNQGEGLTEGNKLTERQREILQLLSAGRSMKEVAIILDIKPSTVVFHKDRIMEMLGIKTNAELLDYGHKLLPSDLN
jgi:DNA-binding NarL/FixJ family response regulator